MAPIIQVEGLGKRYRIGVEKRRADTLLAQLAGIIRSPLQNLKRLSGMGSFSGDDESVFWALKDINFEVQAGEVLGIIGHNGSGKSTLLKILSRITEPSLGEVRLGGHVSALLEVGTGFHPELSGRENIFLNGTILGMNRREIQSKFDEIVEFSGVAKYIDTPVKFYSSGMKVRLGFAVAAHLEPEILVIDEVLAVGDAEFQKKCLGKIQGIASGQGRTVLFVSHDMKAVAQLCPNTLLLKQGQIAAHGPSRQLINQYLQFSEGTAEQIRLKAYAITHFEINGQQSTHHIHLHCREAIRISMHLENTAGIFFNPVLKFTFRAEDGQVLFTVSNLYANIAFGEWEGERLEITCTIPNNPLLPGAYWLDLEFRNEFRKEFQIEAFSSILVVENLENPIGQAKLLKKGLWIESSWHCNAK
jgi:lipopolysaccharide transport system ATP-binding protein